MPSTIEKMIELNYQLKEIEDSINLSDLHDYIRGLKAQYPKVKYVLVEGWTPSFNDGEPCTFNMNVYTGKDEELFANIIDQVHKINDEDYKVLQEINTNEDLEYYEKCEQAGNFVCGDTPKDKIDELRRRIYDVDNLLTKFYGTIGFHVFIDFTQDGDDMIQVSDYDCGY